MSTENNNKQTLFRFVSYRNPNLAETESINLKFIQRNPSLTGVFDAITVADKQTKMEALLQEASNFKSNAIKSIETLEKGAFGDLIKIGKAISSKKEISAANLETCKTVYDKNKTSDALKSIWDNFIYQYLTQENFYIKENIAFVLKALHVGYVQTIEINEDLKQINGEDLIKAALKAVLIIPTNILGEETSFTVSRTVNAKKELSDKATSSLVLEADRVDEKGRLIDETKILETLKSEISTIQTQYWAAYQVALKNAREAYDKQYGAILASYEAQLLVIEDLELSKASEDDIKRAYEVLEEFSAPVFEFSFEPQLDWNRFYNQLSEASLGYFLEEFSRSNKTIDTSVDLEKATIKIETPRVLVIDAMSFEFIHEEFDALMVDIEAAIRLKSVSALSQTHRSQDQFVNVGGMLVPVLDTVSEVPHLSYTLRAQRLGFLGMNRGSVRFNIHVDNASWSMSSVIVTATTGGQSYVKNISALNVVGNQLILPSFLRNKIRDIRDLKIQIFFTNGREATLDLATVAVNKLYTGILNLKPVGTSEGNDDTPVEEGTMQSKNHFGLKRLGVAEYMKVVQSVHAYVPGEVSNIENVMASELRHKSINELTRTENTVTTSKSQEVEKLSDTTKVDRAEMQTEVAKELEEQQSFNAHANFSYDTKMYRFDMGTAFASNNAQFTSNSQAVAKSQEITERAMERVQSKISEERISKIIQEVSLTNVHEYDNRGGIGENTERPKHITGVYRWVDKKMKNQIYNYGKRTMFEFMIPEPAKLHRLAIANTEKKIEPPIDPRKALVPHTMSTALTATEELLTYWAGIYGVELEPLPEASKTVEKIFNRSNIMPAPGSNGGYNFNLDFEKEEGYDLLKYDVRFQCHPPYNGRHDWHTLSLGAFSCGSGAGSGAAGASFQHHNIIAPSQYKNADFSATCNGRDIGTFHYKFDLYYSLSDATINAWKRKHFDLIIEAYQAALDAHNEEIALIEAQQKAKQAEQKDTMGNFYRIIEANVIKHNCVAYLLQNYLTTLGQDFTDGDKMHDFRVTLGEDLDRYTAKAKFLEQAFEWSIMDYTFYPYFWANRDNWKTMYLSENTDTLFRNFLQAGMARVVVTVKPGFEEAVQYFLETGDVWMGGETPVIGDPLYMSIVQEMQEPTGIAQGNYWITRIPTTLTILQAKSAGLEVEQALPIFPEDEPENCENPEQLETTSAFNLDDAQLTATGTSDTTLHSN